MKGEEEREETRGEGGGGRGGEEGGKYCAMEEREAGDMRERLSQGGIVVET